MQKEKQRFSIYHGRVELHNVPRGALSRVIKEFITRDKVHRNTSWEIYSRLLVAQTHVAVLFPTCGKVSRSTLRRLFPHVGKYAAARRADVRLTYIIIYTRVHESERECGKFSCFPPFWKSIRGCTGRKDGRGRTTG
jgi:hypothetical protein